MSSKILLGVCISVLLLIGNVSFLNSYAITIGNSESTLSENQYSFGPGILEYRQVDAGPCMFNIPNYAMISVDSSEQTLLNVDEFQHNFFAVIGNHNDSSYQYLQIGLPPGSGHPSYILDLTNETKQLRGGFYHDYENMVVLIESDRMTSSLSDDSYKRFFTGTSKDITHSRHTFDPGNYNFGAMLLKSSKSSWISNEECVIRVDWPFTINQDGNAVVDEPVVNVGKLLDVTEDFAPLKQHKAGVFAIDCKSGLRLIFKTSDDSGNKVPACVTPETQTKLIERGWGLSQ